MTRRIEPYDPYCKRYASDMPELDELWAETPEELAAADEDTKQWERIDYAIHDATYQQDTRYFACDSCYEKFGEHRQILLHDHTGVA